MGELSTLDRAVAELVHSTVTEDADPRSLGRTARAKLAIAYDIGATSPLGLADLLSDVCDIVWVVDLDDPSLGPMGRVLDRIGAVVDVAGRGLSDVARSVRAHGAAGVIAFCDTQVPRAATLAASLGVEANPPEVVARLTDKFAQREALAAAGIDVPEFRLIDADAGASSAMGIAGELTFPVVVKPVHGDSSRDVVAAGAPADVARAIEVARAHDPTTRGFVVEEYLVGTDRLSRHGLGAYVSVEVIVQHNKPVPLAVTGKFPLAEPFREAGNFMPHPLRRDEAAEVLELARRSATVLGVRTGALHVEVKLTPDGPRIIEVNGRVGGGAIDSIYLQRTGRSLTELAARVALGERVALTPEAPAESSGPFTYEYFVQPPTDASRLMSIASGDSIVGIAGAQTVAVNRNPGDELDWRAGSQGYVLRAGGVAPDLAALVAVPAAITQAAALDYE